MSFSDLNAQSKPPKIEEPRDVMSLPQQEIMIQNLPSNNGRPSSQFKSKFEMPNTARCVEGGNSMRQQPQFTDRIFVNK